MPRSRSLALGLVLATAGACKDPDDTDTGEAPVVRVVLSSASRLVPGTGETAAMRATAFDADGEEVPGARFTWVSDDADVVSVSAQGVLEAHAVGSTLVRASVGDVESDPTLAWVATVPDGAVVVDDDQVVAGPTGTLAGPTAIGARYDVVLSGVPAPSPGTIVLSAGDAPVAGRVVTATEGTEGVAVQLEVVGLPDLLVDVDLSLHRTVEVAAAARADFTLGDFECQSSATGDAWPVPTFAGALTNGLTVDEDFVLVEGSTTVEHAMWRVSGMVRADVAGGVTFPVTLQGSVECERELRVLRFPLPGLFGLLVAKVPLSIGFAAEGSFEGTAVTYTATGFVRAQTTLGFEYTLASGFDELSTWEPTHDLDVHWDTPALDQGATVKASLFPYLAAGLLVGPPVGMTALDFDLAKLKAGVKGEYELSAPLDQVNDPTSASKYEVKAHGELSAGQDYKDLLEFFGLEVETIQLDPPEDSAMLKSPVGTTTASSQDVVADEPITFTTTLDPVTVDFDDGYNVESVHVWREDPQDGWQEVAEVPASAPGQTAFDWEWTPTQADEDEGETEFAWYVETPRMPDTLLEIEPDSRERVGGPPLAVTAVTGTQLTGYLCPPDYLASDAPLPVTLTTTCATLHAEFVNPKRVEGYWERSTAPASNYDWGASLLWLRIGVSRPGTFSMSIARVTGAQQWDYVHPYSAQPGIFAVAPVNSQNDILVDCDGWEHPENTYTCPEAGAPIPSATFHVDAGTGDLWLRDHTYVVARTDFVIEFTPDP